MTIMTNKSVSRFYRFRPMMPIVQSSPMHHAAGISLWPVRYPPAQRDIPHPWGVLKKIKKLNIHHGRGMSPSGGGHPPGQRDILLARGISPTGGGYWKKSKNWNTPHRWGISLWAGGYLTGQGDIPARWCIGLDCSRHWCCDSSAKTDRAGVFVTLDLWIQRDYE